MGGGQQQRNIGHKKVLKFISKNVRFRASDDGEMYRSRMEERTGIIVTATIQHHTQPRYKSISTKRATLSWPQSELVGTNAKGHICPWTRWTSWVVRTIHSTMHEISDKNGQFEATKSRYRISDYIKPNIYFNGLNEVGALNVPQSE